jgi:phosphoribosylglycinamide formyltransferase-1
MSSKVNIAIFASGQGSNARNIVNYFEGHPIIQVNLLLSNRLQSGIPDISKENNIPFNIFSREEFYHSDVVWKNLDAHHIDFIVLAGFLWLVPEAMIQRYPEKIINIHPALLPKFGGKGMFGINVHQAVKAQNEPQTGITIHLVNEEYDKGRVLFQATTIVDETDTPEDIAHKVHELEYQHFPKVIEDYVLGFEK